MRFSDNCSVPLCPEELVPFQSWGRGYVVCVDEVPRIKHREIRQLFGEISGGSL